MSSVLCALCKSIPVPVNPVTPETPDKLSTSLSSWLLKSTVKIIRDFIAPQRKTWWIQHCRTRDCMKNMMQPGGPDQPGSKSGYISTMPGISWRLSGHIIRQCPSFPKYPLCWAIPVSGMFSGTVQRDGSNELLLDYIRRALEQGHNDYPMISGYTRFMINPETRVIAVDLNNVAGDKTPAGRLKPASCTCLQVRSPVVTSPCHNTGMKC